MLLHAPLLRLPYFWDEAGYYVPAARDLYLSGRTHSAIHPLECASSAGDGLAGAGMAHRRIFATSHAHGHAGAVSVFVAGAFSAVAGRREPPGGLGDDRAGRDLSRLFHAKFSGAGRPARRRIYLLGVARLPRRSSVEAGPVVLAGGTRERDRNLRPDGVVCMASNCFPSSSAMVRHSRHRLPGAPVRCIYCSRLFHWPAGMRTTMRRRVSCSATRNFSATTWPQL